MAHTHVRHMPIPDGTVDPVKFIKGGGLNCNTVRGCTEHQQADWSFHFIVKQKIKYSTCLPEFSSTEWVSQAQLGPELHQIL